MICARNFGALLIGVCVALQCGAVGAENTDYQKRSDVLEYIALLVDEHDFDRAGLLALFGAAQKQEHVLKAMQRPYEAKPYPEYRGAFLTEQRILGGVKFWRQHAALFARVERKYGVPTEYLLAIIGVETNYGASLGRTRIIDALVTLGFDYPRRAKFFRGELTNLLLLAREEGLDLEKIKGSYAGAMGLGQFIPGSYREYAVDFDGDGTRNLWRVDDAVASVANYLKRHAWRKDAPVAERLPATVTVSKASETLFNRKAKPWLGSARQLKQLPGIKPRENKFSLYSFDLGGERTERWMTYHNLYVITRYNHSHKYALAIHQLSQAIKQRYAAPRPLRENN